MVRMGQFAALRSMLGLSDPLAMTDAGRKATALLLREMEHTYKLLNEQKRELDTVLDNILQGVVMLDADARILVCNKRYLEIYGLSPKVVKPGCTLKELIRHRVEIGYFHGDVDNTVRNILATLAQRKPLTATTRLANGRIISVFTQPIAEGGGWIVTHQEVTEQRRAEQEADSMQRFLLSVIENVPSAVIVKSVRDLRYVLINKAGEKFYGLHRSAIIDRTAAELFPKPSADAIAAQDKMLLQLGGGITAVTQTVETPANGLRHVIARRLAMRDGDGTPQFLLSIIDDLTDRKSAAA